MTGAISGANILAGERSAEQAGKITSVDPRTGERGDILYPEATRHEIDRAVGAAAEAFESTRDEPSSRLADVLDAIGDEIEAVGDLLLETADAESGLGLPRLRGERDRTTGQLRKFGGLLREGSYVEAIIDIGNPDASPVPKPDVRRMLVPLGPVAVFSASNFPLAFSVAGGDTASAFAAGCPVIVKAHPGHPATSELTAQAVARAVESMQFPPGFFSMLHGAEHRVGQDLVQHPGIRAAGFTGSLGGGRALFDAAADRPVPIPVYAEMGSENPVVITEGALSTKFDDIADGLTSSLTLGSGQFCTNPGLVFVPAVSGQAFIDAVTDRMSGQPAGVLLNAGVEQGLETEVERTLQTGKIVRKTGAEKVRGSAFCYRNTVLQTKATAFLQDEQLQAEHFGPVVLFVTYASYEELAAALRALPGNLTGTIHATDGESKIAAEVCSHLREKVGRLIWNGYPTGVAVGYAMQHGGPYPATTAPGTTSVGMAAIKRFLRPVAYQDMPDRMLPAALRDANPLRIFRLVDGRYSPDPIERRPGGISSA